MTLRKNSAFTMFEILIVVGIIAFLFVILVPRVIRQFGQTEVAKTKLKMEKLKEGLLLYKQAMGHYPTRKEDSLQALLKKPSVPGSERWTGPYVDGEDDLIDSWSTQFEFNAPPVKHKEYHYFEIISTGRSEEEGGELSSGA